MIKYLVYLFTKTPFYPYWLIFQVADRGNKKLLENAFGITLNVGCGADDQKKNIEGIPAVRSYVTLDYPNWDNNWDKLKKDASIFNLVKKVVYRNIDRKPDIWGDGYYLPFADKSIDTIISQGVLEHIEDPKRFLTEHRRVLQKNGVLLMTTPLMYQAHGGNPSGSDDYFRFTDYGLISILKHSGFTKMYNIPYGYFGTTISQLIISYIIKIILKFPKYLIFFLIPLLSLIFLIINIISFLLDLIAHDRCYVSGFFTLAQAGNIIKKRQGFENKSWQDFIVCPKCHVKLNSKSYCEKCRKVYYTNNRGFDYTL
jgi:SAM-dependent methyltransferase